MSLVELIVERGADAIDAMPEGIKGNQDASSETIENNVRKLIIDETPVNPKYYEQMSDLLDALVEQRKADAISYAEYLAKIVELAKKVHSPEGSGTYPATINSAAKRALFDNLGKDEALAVAVDDDIRRTKKADWRGNMFKEREVRRAIARHISDPALVEMIFDLAHKQHEY